jgi:hypothetical protein
MPKFRITQKDGTKREVEGRKFAHYVGAIRYWFFYHTENGTTTCSHLDSGKRVCAVTGIVAARGDVKAAAKADLDRLIARLGEARVRSCLNAETPA